MGVFIELRFMFPQSRVRLHARALDPPKWRASETICAPLPQGILEIWGGIGWSRKNGNRSMGAKPPNSWWANGQTGCVRWNWKYCIYLIGTTSGELAGSALHGAAALRCVNSWSRGTLPRTTSFGFDSRSWVLACRVSYAKIVCTAGRLLI